MAHREQQAFIQAVKDKFPSYFHQKKVLEVGSLNINGSVRDFFTSCDYTGLDVGEGPGVDVVCEGQNYDGPSASFDVVISCECFEHNPHWEATWENMLRVCKPGGMVIMTCATTGRPEHGTERTTPKDSPLTTAKGWHYYQNLTAEDIAGVAPVAEYFRMYQFLDNQRSKDLYFWGIRK